MLSGVAFRAGPKGGYHARENTGWPLPSRCWEVLPCPGFGPTCGTSRPTGAGRWLLPPNLRARWVAAVELQALGGWEQPLPPGKGPDRGTAPALGPAAMVDWDSGTTRNSGRPSGPWTWDAVPAWAKKGRYLGGNALGDSLVAFSSGRKPPCGANPSCLVGRCLQILDNPSSPRPLLFPPWQTLPAGMAHPAPHGPGGAPYP